ncbi:MAG: LCP family protein, partial [Myxococcales bacterium]|nr:LCP family protein [Myxococcales bacterium]
MASPRLRATLVPLVAGLALGVGTGLAWLTEPAHAPSASARAVEETETDTPVVLAVDPAPTVDAPPSEPTEPLEATDDAAPTPRVDAGPPELVRADRVVERAPTPAFDEVETYLLAGIDRTRSGGFGRTDTLVVALFDDATGHVGLVSIPRDLLVDVPGHGLARINATLRIASRLGVDPVATLRRVVGDVLGFEIDHAILGDLDVFEQTVDALG